MELIKKFNEIIEWQKIHFQEAMGELNAPIDEKEIAEIERLLDGPLPAEFKELYQFSNGQKDSGNGLLFGHGFMRSEEIIKALDFSVSLLKPATPIIQYPEKSKKLIDEIVAVYKAYTPKRSLFGLKKSWYKMVFSCSPDAFEGPYLYQAEDSPDEERQTIKITDYEPLDKLVGELYQLEKPGYNWDNLHFVLFYDGSYRVERTYFDFDNQIAFTSMPENAIKKKYFHYKWLPIFSDYGGNYIGIDLDPDVEGLKGQIINFGRDEEHMFVIAKNLEAFFDLLLAQTKNNADALKSSTHLHDTLKEILFP